MSKTLNLPDVYDIVVPCNVLAGFKDDHEFIVVRADAKTVTVKDFFSGKRHTAAPSAFRSIRSGDAMEVSFANMF